MDRPNTTRALLASTRAWLEKKGVPEARLDAELLVAHALGKKRLDLFLDLDRPVTDAELDGCRALIVRRGKREPLSYITGTRDFYGLTFHVSPDVLIPRQDTEALIDATLLRVPTGADGTFIDVCTGSGCVALAILHERKGLRAVATDLSGAALTVARDNATRLGLADRFDARQGDLLAPCSDVRARFVVANPPYVTSAEMPELMPEVGQFEPQLALLGEASDGLGHHRRILAQAEPLLLPEGFVALEIGAGQGRAALELASGRGSVAKDLSGTDRVLVVG